MRISLWLRMVSVLILLSCIYTGPARGEDGILTLAEVTRQANSGDPDAQTILGALYQLGNIVPLDLKLAAAWYAKAAAQGNATAQAHLGALYVEGRGVPKDVEKGIALISRSAEQGTPIGIARLGKAYLSGIGVPSDPERALKLLNKAADMKVGLAAYELGRASYFGIGVPRDPAAAEEWCRKSAEFGYAPGQFLYQNDYEKDEVKRLELIRKSAEGGFAEAQLLLGDIYHDPKPPLHDIDKAIGWYTKAALNGNDAGNKALLKLGLPDVNGNLPANPRVAPRTEPAVKPDDNSAIIGGAILVGTLIFLGLAFSDSGAPTSSSQPSTPEKSCWPCIYGEADAGFDMCQNLETGAMRPKICY